MEAMGDPEGFLDKLVEAGDLLGRKIAQVSQGRHPEGQRTPKMARSDPAKAPRTTKLQEMGGMPQGRPRSSTGPQNHETAGKQCI